MPLVQASSLRRLLDEFRSSQVSCVIATAEVEDPQGFGRVLRNEAGEFIRIVEEVDASEQERRVREINSSIYAFRWPDLAEALGLLRPNNRQGEYYLTDCPSILMEQGKLVRAARVLSAEEALGVNSRAELARVHGALQRRIQQRWMAAGVTILDPATTYIDARVLVKPDTVIHPFSYIDGPNVIEEGCEIGPFAYVPPHANLARGSRIFLNWGPAPTSPR
jgi:bifunctional UDP-N-acetylglucosamine pyrophosphorylase/glucosamine-1-phosphate N-acetyltransferase